LASEDAAARLRAVLLVDAANVIGSRPNGWWRDRPGSARRFVEDVRAARRAERLPGAVVIVLEGQARPGAAEGEADHVRVVHAASEGDDTLALLAAEATEPVTLVSADRGLRERTQAVGAEVVGPRWLLERLEGNEIEWRHQAAIDAGEPGYADPETGLFVFTATYHLERGTCCDSGCRHCPYDR
jgi:hypothetical protein